MVHYLYTILTWFWNMTDVSEFYWHASDVRGGGDVVLHAVAVFVRFLWKKRGWLGSKRDWSVSHRFQKVAAPDAAADGAQGMHRGPRRVRTVAIQAGAA